MLCYVIVYMVPPWSKDDLDMQQQTIDFYTYNIIYGNWSGERKKLTEDLLVTMS